MSEVGFLIFGSTVASKYAIYLTNKKKYSEIEEEPKVF